MTTIVTAVLARAPDWLRQDMLSKDDAARERAEETLAAMIATAIADQDAAADSDPVTAG